MSRHISDVGVCSL